MVAVLGLAIASLALVAARPTAAATPGDEVWTWGRNQYGQLGNGSVNAAGQSVAGLTSLPSGTSVTQVSGGYGFSEALTSTGQVLAWGQNDVGQLGDGSFTNSTVPVNVQVPDGTTVTAIAVGDDHILALTSTGQVLAWGYNDWGQLGNGTTEESNVPVPVDLPDGTTVTAIGAGAGHSLALTSTGQVLAWGDNDLGQLGDGTRTDRYEPVEVELPTGTTAIAIVGGDDHSLALTSSGQLLAWGYNGSGQLGDGTTTTRTAPVTVHLPTGTSVSSIAAGSGFQSFAITAAGSVLAWGDNSYGQLGDGTTTRRTEPVTVSLPTGTTVTALDSGDDHTVALTSDGQVLAWGYNRYGQVGDGTTTNRSEPVEVQFGDRTTAVRTKPVRVLQPTGATVVAIGVGSYHSLAIAQTAQSTTTLASDSEQAQTGTAVTFTATVTCTVGSPTGTVTFTDDGQEIGSASLEDGIATLVIDDLAEGQHTITANYAGDASCPASSSEPVTVAITAEGSSPTPTPTREPTLPPTSPGPIPGEPAPGPTTGGVVPPTHGGLADSGTTALAPGMIAAVAGTLAVGGIALLIRRRRLLKS
ncbi:Ig-like domain repeat protein [Streptomyces sp. NPDC002896]|uniref:RCC1 domain-containing protein n=1 Tax=Streptomyces sp. NPDC002896 TaxID=3154438 RepID=UPI0033275E4D